MVRVTHWLTVLSFFALLVSGLEIVVSHPRFYWGETGNSNTKPAFIIPIPASRGTVPTGYGYEMPDQNGWSRYLHFQAAWLAVLTGLFYGIHALLTGHFRGDLLPAPGDRNWPAVRAVFSKYRRRGPPDPAEGHTYNVVQRIAYILVIFVLFPLIIWTGLAMSPSFVSAFPLSVELLGGRQTARTLHFFITWLLVAFVVIHVAMVYQSGFRDRMRAMITGRTSSESSERKTTPGAVAQESL